MTIAGLRYVCSKCGRAERPEFPNDQRGPGPFLPAGWLYLRLPVSKDVAIEECDVVLCPECVSEFHGWIS